MATEGGEAVVQVADGTASELLLKAMLELEAGGDEGDIPEADWVPSPGGVAGFTASVQCTLARPSATEASIVTARTTANMRNPHTLARGFVHGGVDVLHGLFRILSKSSYLIL